MRRLLAFVVIAAGVVAVGAPAMAQTATTNVQIIIPSFTMLYYRSQVTFDINDTVMSTLIGEAGNLASEGAATLTDFSSDAGVDGVSTGFTALASTTATVTNFWGVRSLAPSGSPGTQVSVAFTGGAATDTLSNTVDSIGLNSLATRVSGGGPFSGSSVTFSPTGLGAGGLQLGDVEFSVDLSGVTTSGNYTGGSIEITAANL